MSTKFEPRSFKGHAYMPRVAYIHKADRSKFGVLEAAGMSDARRHLGGKFHIHPVWAHPEDDLSERGTRWRIVYSTFFDPTRSSFVGMGRHEYMHPNCPPTDD